MKRSESLWGLRGAAEAHLGGRQQRRVAAVHRVARDVERGVQLRAEGGSRGAKGGKKQISKKRK